MSSLFDKLFPRISKRVPPETTIEPRTPFQPRANEPKDPVLEIIREELQAKRDFHEYGYEKELEDFAVYLQQNKGRLSRRERETNSSLAEELKKEEGKAVVLGNPNTMWAYGVGGAIIGFSIAGLLMRKHVEPLTTLVFTSLSGLGAYTGSKLDELGYLPPIPYFQPPPAPSLPLHVSASPTHLT